MLDAGQIATLVSTAIVVRRPHAAVPRRRPRPADAGRGGEPATRPAAGHQRRARVAGRRGCCRASSPAWPACSSPRCSRSSTRSTSSPCWSRPSPPACSATSPASSMTFVGGLLLGVLQAELAGFLPTDSIVAPACARRCRSWCCSCCVLVKSVGPRRSARRADPLAGVDPPPAPPAATLRPPWMTNAHPRRSACVAGAIGLFIALFVFDDYWLSLVTGGVALAVIMLSVVMTTGIGGTISLCQAHVRGHRRVHHRAARRPLRHVGARRHGRRRGSSPRSVGAAARRSRSSGWPASTRRSPRWRSRSCSRA